MKKVLKTAQDKATVNGICAAQTDYENGRQFSDSFWYNQNSRIVDALTELEILPFDKANELIRETYDSAYSAEWNRLTAN